MIPAGLESERERNRLFPPVLIWDEAQTAKREPEKDAEGAGPDHRPSLPEMSQPSENEEQTL